MSVLRVLFVFALCSSSAFAQISAEPWSTFEGRKYDTFLGSKMEVAGDLDQDGVLDLGLRTYHGEKVGRYHGGVEFFSSATGKYLNGIYGRPFSAWLGEYGFTRLFDYDHDGKYEIIISGGGGLSSVFSDFNSDPIKEFPSISAFSKVVLEIDDVDGDGVRDFFVDPVVYSGDTLKKIHVIGFDGVPIMQYQISSSGIPLEFAHNLGDLDGDGVREIIAKSYYGTDLFVFSPRTGKIFYQVKGYFFIQPTGSDVISDIDGDQFPDFIYGVGFLGPEGQVGVVGFSGKTGTELFQIVEEKPTYFGYSVTKTGDLDGDGVGDFAVGAPHLPYYTDGRGNAIRQKKPGYVALYSGRTRQEIGRLTSPIQARTFGTSLLGGVDLDQDGKEDLVVGASWAYPDRRGVVSIFRFD